MQRTLIAPVLFLSLIITACSGGSGSDAPKDNGNGLTDIRAYMKDSPYAEVIATCAKAKQAADSCLLNELPFIAQETSDPDIDKIMSRVVVSHNWMGQRFAQALERMPPGMLKMFSALTAIVIDADIRPAYYNNLTGAIYIDPQYLWVSDNERQTISTRKDYRSDFADPLAFSIFSRYLKDGDYAYGYWPLGGSGDRRIEDIELPLARILLHELAHANDFLPPGSAIHLNTALRAADALNSLSVPLVSSELVDFDPLTSDLMYSIAGVMYRGTPPSTQDLLTTATEAANAFENDVASDDYGYTSQYEDLAMLFENTMMSYYFGAEHEIGFARPNFSSAYYCDEYTIDWGTLNRIGDPDVKERARFISDAILPEEDLSGFYASLPPPESRGSYWCISTLASMTSSPHTPYDQNPIRPDEYGRPYR